MAKPRAAPKAEPAERKLRRHDAEDAADRDKAAMVALVAKLEAKAADLERARSQRPGPPSAARPKEVRCCASFNAL